MNSFWKEIGFEEKPDDAFEVSYQSLVFSVDCLSNKEYDKLNKVMLSLPKDLFLKYPVLGNQFLCATKDKDPCLDEGREHIASLYRERILSWPDKEQQEGLKWLERVTTRSKKRNLGHLIDNMLGIPVELDKDS